MSQIKQVQLVGRVVRVAIGILLIFKFDGRYYQAVGLNAEILEAYLQTGDAFYLSQLENAMEAAA